MARGRTGPQIAQEIHDQCGPLFGTSRIKAHRLALGVALSDVVAQVRALYEIEGRPPPKLGETLLSAYESGHKRPGPEYLHYLCLVYRVEPDQLGYRASCVCGRGHATRPPPAASRPAGQGDPDETDDGVVTGAVIAPLPGERLWRNQDPSVVLEELRARTRADGPVPGDEGEGDIVLRRTLLHLMAGAGVALDGQFLGAIDNLRRRVDDALVTASISPTMLDRWEETTLGYGQQYMTTPPLRMLCDVLLDLNEVRHICEQRQPIELQERLCRIAAQLAGLAGIVMIDLGDHRLARSFFRTARTAADETGDRSLRAWIAVREALVPMYYGDPRETLHLARRAQDLAGRMPCVAAAMAPILEARALGQLVKRGRTDASTSARRALVRGRAVFGQMGKQDQGDPAYGFTERQLLFYEGDTYINLGDPRRADESLSQALTMYSARERLDRTLIRLNRATCRFQEGEPEQALHDGMTAILDLPAEHRTEILLLRARQLGNAVVSRHGEIPAARDFREALAAPSVQSPMGDS